MFLSSVPTIFVPGFPVPVVPVLSVFAGFFPPVVSSVISTIVSSVASPVFLFIRVLFFQGFRF
jgi:hypothetical protein